NGPNRRARRSGLTPRSTPRSPPPKPPVPRLSAPPGSSPTRTAASPCRTSPASSTPPGAPHEQQRRAPRGHQESHDRHRPPARQPQPPRRMHPQPPTRSTSDRTRPDRRMVAEMVRAAAPPDHPERVGGRRPRLREGIPPHFQGTGRPEGGPAVTLDDLRLTAIATLAVAAALAIASGIHAFIIGSWGPLIGAANGAAIGLPIAAAWIPVGDILARLAEHGRTGQHQRRPILA